MNEMKLRDTLLALITMLVHGDYYGVNALCRGRTPPVDVMERLMADYPARFVMPPDDALEHLADRGYVEVLGRVPSTWRVDACLWSHEEGISDLRIVMEVIESPGELYDTVINDLHVL